MAEPRPTVWDVLLEHYTEEDAVSFLRWYNVHLGAVPAVLLAQGRGDEIIRLWAQIDDGVYL